VDIGGSPALKENSRPETRRNPISYSLVRTIKSANSS
jgi:hypothetical protein